MIRALGRPDTVRKILKRGSEYTKDDIAGVYNLAINYERKFGSLEELQNAEKRFKTLEIESYFDYPSIRRDPTTSHLTIFPRLSAPQLLLRPISGPRDSKEP